MSAPDLAPGQIVAGTYGIQSRLGHGGAIATFHAMTAPNRQVALKLYDPALRSFPDVLKMLGRHQMTATALAARSIAPVTESGEDPATGAPFTVTDFEVHPTLKDLVELCPLSTAEMVTLLGNLGRCIDLLHSYGIVHLALALILRELDAIDEGDSVREQLVAFASKGDVYATLFVGAGPADDGTLDAARVADNVTRVSNAKDAEEKLAQWLYDYASYALFIARPHLQRVQAARDEYGGAAAAPKRLSQRVNALLQPIAKAPRAGEPADRSKK